MAQYIFRLPDVGEGIAEAEIAAWHVAIGDVVGEDQLVAELMTDKATIEMESPVAGAVVELAGEPGESLAIGSPLFILETESGSEAHTTASGNNHFERPSDDNLWADSGSGFEGVDDPAVIKNTGVPDENLAVFDRNQKRVLASPAVRARAQGLHIDLADVKFRGDRIRHADLDSYLKYKGGSGFQAPAAVTRPDEQVKIIGMRRSIADNMSEAKRHIPHFTYVEEVDVTAAETVRTQLNSARGAKPKITFLPLMITAICKAIPSFPMINARYDDDAGIVTRIGTIDLGMATQTNAGLMVPVIRSAEQRNIWQLAQEIIELADGARFGNLRSDQMSGGTLTLTSLGPLGGIATTPIINRPEVAIIGPNRIFERPVLDDDRLYSAKLMNISISCDHRVIDGWDAASFIQLVKKYLEKPALLFTSNDENERQPRDA
ncbi:dihydrolipoamide acetyltransferase family protein [Novosphingopyxis sp.]|uniref:dihydrolipoamide acetyltransferase family protein n=1 Tax=Novosphingopyxis sp. TaxID=2709690 RepID=UPI003B5A678F